MASMCSLSPLFRAALLLAIVGSTASVGLDDFLEWFEENGGQVHPSVSVTSQGMVATQDIPAKQALWTIPGDLVFAVEVEQNDDGGEELLWCDFFDAMGEDDVLLDYLHQVSQTSTVSPPAFWSEEGKFLLDQVLGEEVIPEEDLSPFHVPVEDLLGLFWRDAKDQGREEIPPLGYAEHFDYYELSCGLTDQEDIDNLETFFVHSFRNRYLVPLYDLVQHRHGHLSNVEGFVYADNSITFRASRPIRAGENLRKSFNDGVTFPRLDYGTAEIFREKGVIENYPRRWIFPRFELVFDVEETFGMDGAATGGTALRWQSGLMTEKSVAYFREQLDRLKIVYREHLTEKPANVPVAEWKTVKEYFSAAVEAIETVLRSIESKDAPEVAKPLHNSKYDGAGSELVQWLGSMGGSVSSKIELHPTDPADPASPLGLFASSDITSMETLLVVPESAMLMSNRSDDLCGMFASFDEETSKGAASSFGPYIEHVIKTTKKIPALWSDNGRTLLHSIIQQFSLDDYMGKVFQRAATLQLPEYVRDVCYFEPKFLEPSMMAVSRAFQSRMVPVADDVRHRGGHWTNAEVVSLDVAAPTQWRVASLRALRDIKAGEEILLSRHDMKKRSIDEHYGTLGVFVRHGVVEDNPREFRFLPLTFVVDSAYDEDGEPIADELVVQSISVASQAEQDEEDPFEFLADMLQRLHDAEELEISSSDLPVPEDELKVIVELHDALTASVEAVLGSFQLDEHDDSCASGTCATRVYSSLADEPLGFPYYHCGIGDDVREWKDWESIDSHQSLYQKQWFTRTRSHNNDTCFILDGEVQICGNYRPQYHESQVQFGTYFLDHVKRALWVGGGDSMILHELLKYPELELAVGLELDQVNPRMCYKHFGSQPHFDDPRVEWWFGDATKSILMLPKEYFKSFDLVLVDLSETVASFKVTEGMDVMEALATLVKPDGIFSKNEHYLDLLGELFAHTVQSFSTDIPTICEQAMNFASNSVDFLSKLKTGAVDHGVENMYLPTYEYTTHLMKDYVFNATAKTLSCDFGQSETTDDSPQTKSPGIALVMEIDDVAIDLSVLSVESAVSRALVDAGLTSIEVLRSPYPDDVHQWTFVLEEGYSVVRLFPSLKYCALDLHLWGSFHNLGAAKVSLQAALAGPTPKQFAITSFRIVAGGMFGVKTWREDERSRGPGHVDCDDSIEEKIKPLGDLPTKSIPNAGLSSVMSYLSALMRPAGAPVLVICGHPGSECASLDAFDSPLALESCPSVVGLNEYQEDASDLMFRCEKSILGAIREAVIGGGKVATVVIDPNADYAMARILYRILSSPYKLKSFFADIILLVAPTMPNFSEDELEWRRNFIEFTRRFVLTYIPVFETVVTINSPTLEGMDLLFTYSGDPDFWYYLNNFTVAVESQTSYSAVPMEVSGGVAPYDSYKVMGRYFYPHDFDQSEPITQYQSQQPLGAQALLQFEVQAGSASLSLDLLKSMVERIFSLLSFKPFDSLKWRTGMGEGGVLSASFAEGSLVLIWDGRLHFDVNMFTFEEQLDVFEQVEAIVKAMPGTSITLRDVFPRGHGRVVNFQYDLGATRETPHWGYSLDG